MALVSGKTILTSLSLFHITLGFFFLTSPVTIADQALVYLLGEAMGMPVSRSFETQSGPLAFLGVVLMIFGISDIATLGSQDELRIIDHWGAQAPLRLTLSLLLAIYTFAFSPSSLLYSSGSGPRSRMSHPSANTRSPGYVPATWGGDGLKNRVFFTFAFVELVSWFWVWVTLREERREVLTRKAMRRRSSQSYGH